jgi:putative ABC transport system substrate-binding protein
VVPGDAFMAGHRALVISLAAASHLPTISNDDLFPKQGGLLSYGKSIVQIFRDAAPYIDRVLHGAKPADLPVQLPTKFDLAVNLKTAKALGLTVPPSMQQLADEVIE